MKATYLDYNAGAPLRPEARAAMLDALGSANPSSVHSGGRKARALVESARIGVASLFAADPENVTFVSGGSEANATVLAPSVRVRGAERRVDTLLVSAAEHPSVRSGGRFPADRVTEIPVDRNGIIDLDELSKRLDEVTARGETALVSVMLANNETGAIQPVAQAAAIARDHGSFSHTDAAQAAGRIPTDLEALNVDFLTLSSHKLGGPQGSGAIVKRTGDVDFAPLIAGGGQERRKRAGTENVAAIAGFGAAAIAASADRDSAPIWADWRDGIATAITEELGAEVFSAAVPRLPQTLCFGIAGLSAETLVIGLDLEGVAVSSGSACSSGKVGPSYVLAAMGIPSDLARSALRISFGWETDQKDLDKFQTALRVVLGRISAARGQAA